MIFLESKVGFGCFAGYLTRDRPDRFYKPARSNLGIFILTKVGSPFAIRKHEHVGVITQRKDQVVTPPSYFSPASKDCSAGKPLGFRPAAPTAGTTIVCSIAGFNFTLFSSPT